jgi:hypothetical protein
MRVIIAGSRGIDDIRIIDRAVKRSGFSPTVVISGGANGVDKTGEMWASGHGIPVERFKADWNRWPVTAGFVRNNKMAENAEALVAVWDGNSRGTAHMIKVARERGLEVFTYSVE